jgi:predicted DNA-binding transcriptional regulator AlpA
MRSPDVAAPRKSAKARLLESTWAPAPVEQPEDIVDDVDDPEDDVASSSPRAGLKPRSKRESASGIRGPPPLLLSRTQVLDLIGVTYVTLYTWMRSDQFPLAVMLGPPEGKRSKIAWHASEVYAWIESRPRRTLRPIPVKKGGRR